MKEKLKHLSEGDQTPDSVLQDTTLPAGPADQLDEQQDSTNNEVEPVPSPLESSDNPGTDDVPREDSSKEGEIRSMTKNIVVPVSQLLVALELFDRMRMPFTMTLWVDSHNRGMHDLNIYYDEKDELLVQWFMEETLRLEARNK